jgi:hypothetical protein
MPKFSNVYEAKRGKMAPNSDRRKVLAAGADAANYLNVSETKVLGQIMNTYHQVGINQIIKRLQEHHRDATRSYNATNCRHDPMDLLPVSGPAEREQTAGEEHGAHHGFGQPPLRQGHVFVGLELAPVYWLAHDHENPGDHRAQHGTQLGKPAHARFHVINPLKNARVGSQEEIEQPINEGRVEARRRWGVSGCILVSEHRNRCVYTL